MKKEELALKLDKVQYRNEISKELAQEAKENNLVVVFGASDDIIELRGAIHDEAYGEAYFTNDGLLENKCDEDDCPYFQIEKEKSAEIKALWCPKKDDKIYASWAYETKIPHSTFNIMEDDELYCVGIVFDLKNLKDE